MQDEISRINTYDKKNKKTKKRKTIPSIYRTDIMSGILSPDLNDSERLKLSNLYAEITYMEKKDMKYIRKITISSQSDSDIYEILKKLNSKNRKVAPINVT